MRSLIDQNEVLGEVRMRYLLLRECVTNYSIKVKSLSVQRGYSHSGNVKVTKQSELYHK